VTACPRPVDSTTWCVASGGTAPCAPRYTFKACTADNGLDDVQAAVRTYEVTLVLPDASITRLRRSSSDPGRALLTGYFGAPDAMDATAIPRGSDDWQKLDIPPLFNIGNTAPYFHNNSAATLDEVLDHYAAFFKRAEINTCLGPTHTCGPALVTSPTNPDGTPRAIPDRPFKPEEREGLLAFLRRL
jgi:hypothetical protein